MFEIVFAIRSKFIAGNHIVGLMDFEFFSALAPGSSVSVIESEAIVESLQLQARVQAGVITFACVLAVTIVIAAMLYRRHRDQIVDINEKLSATIARRDEEIAYRKLIENELATAAEIAEENNNAKSQFLANVSHELRTPMNCIIGFSSILKSSPLSAEQRAQIDHINEAGEDLLRLIDDLLDLSRIEAGKFGLKSATFNIEEITTEASAQMRALAKEKDLFLKLDVDSSMPRLFVGDAFRIKQILLNLVGNAIKFTQFGGVTVRVGYSRNNETVQFIVKDSGIGIAEADLSRIFQRFYQVDGDRTRRFPGTGMGLAICSELANAMGGELVVESEVGVGSQFRISLPLESVQLDILSGNGMRAA